jgi:hypothetical protein
MSAPEFEAFLARIYVDASARAAFKANPQGEALRGGLSKEECMALGEMDWVALEMAARSFANKRRSKPRGSRPRTFIGRVRQVAMALWHRIRSGR